VSSVFVLKMPTIKTRSH